MNHVRPYKIFSLIEAPPWERTVRVPIPTRRAVGGMTLLETFLVIAASRIVSAKRIFEFGTFLGKTTLNLALNVPDDAEIFTLDLGPEDAETAEQHPKDVELTRIRLASRNELDFNGTPVSSKITTLFGDSNKFDYSTWKDSIDMAFIDGGHDPATVTSDTNGALLMARKDRPSCILWHDYGNSEYGDLTGYLDELSQRLDVFHVEDTMLCVWFNDSSRSIRHRLSNKE
jgi:Methyltransferase domain